MPILVITVGHDPQGEYRQCSFSLSFFNDCLEALSILVGEGWQFQRIYLYDQASKPTRIPVEAIDGSPLCEPLEQLEQEWQALLRIA